MITWKRAKSPRVVFSDDNGVRVSACGRFRIEPRWTVAGNVWILISDGVRHSEDFRTRGAAKLAALSVVEKAS